MKKASSALLIILLSFVTCISFGQKIRFTDSLNRWRVVIYSCGGDEDYATYREAYYTGDTIIHGLKYYKQREAGFCQFLGACSNTYIREDTLIGKVFAVSPVHDTDTAEYVLYDYSLQVGDTLRNVNCVQRVAAIDSIQVNGVWHRTWRFDNLTPHTSSTPFIGYTVIEGIGCTSTPMYPYYPYFFEHCWQLTCFYNKGSKPVLSDTVGYIFDNANSCSFVDIKRFNNHDVTTRVQPNPIDETSKIVLPFPVSGSCTIYNTVGIILTYINLNQNSKIPIDKNVCIPGIYYYVIKDAITGQTFTGKFVKHKIKRVLITHYI